MKSIEECLASNLKRLRKSRGFTQETLAEATDLTSTTIAHIKTCRRWPEKETLARIARALEVPTTALFFDPEALVKPSIGEALEVIHSSLGYEASKTLKNSRSSRKGTGPIWKAADSQGTERRSQKKTGKRKTSKLRKK